MKVGGRVDCETICFPHIPFPLFVFLFFAILPELYWANSGKYIYIPMKNQTPCSQSILMNLGKRMVTRAALLIRQEELYLKNKVAESYFMLDRLQPLETVSRRK